MGDDGFRFDIEAPDLRGLLAHVRQFDPKLATDLRRALRQAGEKSIAESRKVLSGPLPGSIARAGTEYRIVKPRGRAPYKAKRIIWDVGAAKASTGAGSLRSQISAGLRTRVTAGNMRQSVSVKTTGPRTDGYNMARTWGKKRFRHPVFGRGWMYQQGQDYFWTPISRNTDAMRESIAQIIDDALARLAQK